MQTAVRMITTGVMMALLAGIASKLKIFGGSPQPRPFHSSTQPYPPSRRVFSFRRTLMTTTFHRHWRDVPESAWRWPNFSPPEIASAGRPIQLMMTNHDQARTS